jgi:hypothetical protein
MWPRRPGEAARCRSYTLSADGAEQRSSAPVPALVHSRATSAQSREGAYLAAINRPGGLHIDRNCARPRDSSRLSPFYPNWTIYSDPFLFDTVYFNRYHPSFQTINLPTGDMIQKALPEGVVEPGGRVSGFLYFEDPDDDVGRVTLTHELTTPMGTKFGQIQIPLLTR